MKIKIKGLKGIRRVFRKHSPDILTACGVVGFIATICIVNEVAPEAKKELDKAEEEKGEKLTAVEKVKTVGKHYILPVATTAASTALVVGGNRIGAKKLAKMTAEYELVENVFRNYRDRTEKELGSEKEEEIAKESVRAAKKLTPMPEQDRCRFADHTTRLKCTDNVSGVVFYATHEEIEDALMNLNDILNAGMNQNSLGEDVSLNEFYSMIPDTRLPMSYIGDEYVWHAGERVYASIDIDQDDMHTPMWVLSFSKSSMPKNFNYF